MFRANCLAYRSYANGLKCLCVWIQQVGQYSFEANLEALNKVTVVVPLALYMVLYWSGWELCRRLRPSPNLLPCERNVAGL